jgi:enoyl-CoA hydratase
MTEALASFDSGGRGDVMAQAVVRVARCPKPVIAAINGYAFGGGAALACACDIRLASERASFRFPGANYGLVVGGSQLPRLVGPAVAKDLIFTARVVEADEARRIGLVNRIVPHDELDGAAWELARQIAAQSPDAVRWSKAVIDAASTVEKGIELEIDANRALRGSDDHMTRFRAATKRVANNES